MTETAQDLDLLEEGLLGLVCLLPHDLDSHYGLLLPQCLIHLQDGKMTLAETIWQTGTLPFLFVPMRRVIVPAQIHAAVNFCHNALNTVKPHERMCAG